MSGHGITSQEDDDSGDEIPLWPSISRTAQPYSHQSSAPPDDPHRCVLQVVMNPWTPPSMLRESVDTSPGGNDYGIEELLAPSSSSDPHLSHEQKDRKDDSVRNKRASHDKVR